MDNNQVTIDCNRQVNLTYLLAGVLRESATVMQQYLKTTNTGLKHEQRMLMTQLLDTCTKQQHLIERLQSTAVLSMDDESILIHEDSIAYYYAIFMKFVSIIGVDHLYGLRAYTLYNILGKFEHKVIFPNAETRYKYAFKTIMDKLNNHEYTEEEVLSCLKPAGNEK